MKICKDPSIPTQKPYTPSKPKTPIISTQLQKLVDSGKEQINVSIRGNGTIPDFRPIKPSGEYYGMPDLTQEQRNEVSAKSKTYVNELQKNLIKFITDNGGKITSQRTYANVLFAEIPSSLVKELEKRSDIVRIDSAEQKYVAARCTENKPC